jgi:hypothetical protein
MCIPGQGEFSFFIEDASSKLLLIPSGGNAPAEEAATQLQVPVATMPIVDGARGAKSSPPPPPLRLSPEAARHNACLNSWLRLSRESSRDGSRARQRLFLVLILVSLCLSSHNRIAKLDRQRHNRVCLCYQRQRRFRGSWGDAGKFGVDVKAKSGGFHIGAAQGKLDNPRADDVALFLHTSGTTSRPKVGHQAPTAFHNSFTVSLCWAWQGEGAEN